MHISHKTSYLSLYVQSRGELRRQLTAYLRDGQAGGWTVAMVNFSGRPAEVADRAVPGHWESDLIMGADNASAVATLVERRTRFVMLAHLGKDRTTETVIEALKQRVQTLPKHLRHARTWDHDRQMAARVTFTIDAGVEVYLCDPHSPWVPGGNESTNGLLRQFLPKNTNLAVHDQAALDHIADLLNGRPRQTLGWENPAERMTKLLAASPEQVG
jgi:IS30 family transposase